ncbi:MAG: hypothetical protein LBI45_07090 [Bacteroidales bacterium]|jgi:hypothetical protein|nr:hypothetical protein [Bacteroidales bacterium]
MDYKNLKIKGVKYNFEPRLLSLIVTDECTAARTNCCFNCSPKKGKTMTIEDMKYYIKKSIKEFKEIKVIVLTGGELFLLGIKSLVEIISYIKSLKLNSRIVSNAFWATTPKKTKGFITHLVEAGLNEINFSTGEEHQKFVKIENIINACIESVKVNLQVAVNIESHPNSNFNLTNLFDHKLFKEFFSVQENIDKIKIVKGSWMSFNNECNTNKCVENKFEPLKKNNFGCDSIFTTFSIFPSGETRSCCGLTVSKIKEFTLGNAKICNIRYLYESQYNNFINLWLKIEGPFKIMEYLSTKEPKINNFTFEHTCQICNYLFNNKMIRGLISKYYIEKIPEVLFKYHIQKRFKNI